MPSVTILPAGVAGEVPAGATLLDAGEEVGAEMEAGCLDCTCGTCAVEVVAGAKNLVPPGDAEIDVLDGWNRDPDRFRLACCAKVLRGRVVIRQLD